MDGHVSCDLEDKTEDYSTYPVGSKYPDLAEYLKRSSSCKSCTVSKTSYFTREITRNTSKILIERNLDRNHRTKDRQDIFGMLIVSNVVIAASNNVMESSDDVLAASDGKNSNAC